VTNTIGSDKEAVRLIINGQEITNIYQEYQVACSMFEQPAGFSLKLGTGAAIADLRKRFKKGDPFQLMVGGRLVSTGIIDGRGAAGTPSVMNFRGRDRTAILMENTVLADTTFQNENYVDLTKKVLELCGVKDPVIFTDNDKARAKFSGIASQTGPGLKFDTSDAKTRATAKRFGFTAVARQIGRVADNSVASEAANATAYALGYVLTLIPVTTPPVITRKTVTAKVGQTWWDFLQDQYKKVGLFLWCTPEGDYVLSEPNPKQPPSYRVLRQRGALRNAVNVVTASIQEGGPGQHLSVTAYGRTGKGKGGRLKARGDYTDESSFAETQLYRMAFYDADIKNNDEALFAARRRIAEERRRGRRLSYVMAGHMVTTANAIGEGGRAIWTPDTVVDVDDHEYGVHEPMYLHSVAFERNKETTTALDLMWIEDLVFSSSMEA
jgi:prophage tail gpP-like protein